MFNHSRLLKFVIVVLTLIIAALICALLWLRFDLPEDGKHTTYREMCFTKECIKISSTILERMDTSVDPCEDMYQYACGNFIQMNTVPEDYYARNLLQEMQEGMFVEMKHNLEAAHSENETNHIRQIKRLYRSCINETDDDIGTSIEALFQLIIELTGSEWPLLTANRVTTFKEVPLERQLALLFLHQVQPFFQIFIAPHKNTSAYALHVI